MSSLLPEHMQKKVEHKSVFDWVQNRQLSAGGAWRGALVIFDVLDVAVILTGLPDFMCLV